MVDAQSWFEGHHVAAAQWHQLVLVLESVQSHLWLINIHQELGRTAPAVLVEQRKAASIHLLVVNLHPEPPGFCFSGPSYYFCWEGR